MTKELLTRLLTPPAWNGIVYLLLGIGFAFAGYKLFKGLRKVYGGMLGVAAGLSLVQHPEIGYRIGAAVLGGVAGLAMADVLYYFLLFLTGGLAAGLGAAIPLMAFDLSEGLGLDLFVGFAFLCGAVLAIVAETPAMIVLTSALGSVMMVNGYNAVAKKATVDGLQLAPIPLAVITVLGIVIQGWLYRRETSVKIIRSEETGRIEKKQP